MSENLVRNLPRKSKHRVPFAGWYLIFSRQIINGIRRFSSIPSAPRWCVPMRWRWSVVKTIMRSSSWPDRSRWSFFMVMYLSYHRDHAVVQRHVFFLLFFVAFVVCAKSLNGKTIFVKLFTPAFGPGLRHAVAENHIFQNRPEERPAVSYPQACTSKPRVRGRDKADAGQKSSPRQKNGLFRFTAASIRTLVCSAIQAFKW